MYPKKYHDVVEQRRRSGLDRPTAVAVPAVIHPAVESVQVPLESPAVDRRSKPKMEEENSFEQPQSQSTQAQPPMKYVPYVETTKPFEMSDFYKYSTKYKKSKNGSESSSSTSSNDNNNKPPELPAKNSPAKGGSAPPPPPPPPKKISSLTTSDQVVSKDLGDAFSSEMLQWYKNSQQRPKKPNEDSNKPATLV